MQWDAGSVCVSLAGSMEHGTIAPEAMSLIKAIELGKDGKAISLPVYNDY